MQPDVFQTLADPTRRYILEALLAGEQQVNDIVDRVDIHQSGVSRHLRILEETGFVRMRPEPFHEIDAWVGRYRALWEARLDRLAEAIERNRKDTTRTKRVLTRARRHPKENP